MPAFPTFVLAVTLASVRGEVFTPCEFVQVLKTLPKYTESTRDMAVCIAGYRNFNTSYFLTHPNGTGFYGIFGIHSHDVRECLYGTYLVLDSDLRDDFYCLEHHVLKWPLNRKSYEKLCSPPYVRNVSCPMSTRYASETVPVPIYTEIFAKAFVTGSDPYDFLPKADEPTTYLILDHRMPLSWIIAVALLLLFFLSLAIGVYILVHCRHSRARNRSRTRTIVPSASVISVDVNTIGDIMDYFLGGRENNRPTITYSKANSSRYT